MITADEKWPHAWGFRDTQFVLGADRSVRLTGDRYEICGFAMPGFMPFVEDALGVEIDTSAPLEPVPEQVAPPNKNAAFCAAVEKGFPNDLFTFDDHVRSVHSHGQATADEVHKALYGKLPRSVDMVFYCTSESEAEELVRLALDHDVCLIPYGGGTNVSGCLKVPEAESRMTVSVDTRGLNRIEWVNQENRQVCAQAGITGLELENELAKRGLTTGHEPDSVEFSTLGGWISTNASGMKKNRYGNIEDIVESISVISPTGRLETLKSFPRQSAGVQVRTMLFGSEGNFGLITKAVMRVRALPEKRSYQSILFPDAERGVAFLHELSGSAFLPASIRLVDNGQFRFGLALKPEADALSKLKSKLQKLFIEGVKHIDLTTMAVATIVMEGSAMEVAVQEKAIAALAGKHLGFMAGAHNGKRGYNLTFAIAYIRDFMTKLDVLGETFETAVPWDKIHKVNAAVIEEAKRIHRHFSLPGKPFISFRVTQIYATGVCIYYTYGIYTKGVENGPQIASEADHMLRRVIVDNGGSVSHHHGIGKFRSDLLAKVLPAHNAEMVQALKTTLDPKNVFGAQNGVFHIATR
jgi:alkyldihydroxyacetonephosphate synthase